MAELLPQVPAVPRGGEMKRLRGHIQGARHLPLPLMEGGGWLGVQVGLRAPGVGSRKRSGSRRGRRGGRVGQLDWGWRVQDEGKKHRARCSPLCNGRPLVAQGEGAGLWVIGVRLAVEVVARK